MGNRTRQLDCAHVEYFRGIRNPIGIKVDSEMSPNELVALLDQLDPCHEPGRITLITRFGADKIWTELPKLIQAVQNAGRQLTTVWSCDPMHGNTYTSSSGLKTRSFDAILSELKNTFEVHEQYGSHLGGVHFELTGEHVTECVGGPQELAERHLSENYTTYCDPRLNYLQGMEMSFLLADLLRTHKTQSSFHRTKSQLFNSSLNRINSLVDFIASQKESQ
jgi:3-deoxy-7-phosphoheptulonate synthase